MRERFGYQWALAGFEVMTILSLVALLWRGAEEHGKSFMGEEKVEVGHACSERATPQNGG